MAVSKFSGQTTAIQQFIAELDQSSGQTNDSSMRIGLANQLLIAIQNAENIECIPEQQSAKAEEFNLMIACLHKTDYCFLNLPHRLRFSIDSGTSDGWFPKLYGVEPSTLIPGAVNPVRFLGKFKYGDPIYEGKYKPVVIVDEETVQPESTDTHVFRFQLKPKTSLCIEDRCSQFYCKLVAPYEAGYPGWRSQKTFTFTVPIRTYPTRAGTLVTEGVPDEVHGYAITTTYTLAWLKEFQITLDCKKVTKLFFTSFDGKKHELDAVQLDREARLDQATRVATSKKFNKKVSYLYLSTIHYSQSTITPDVLWTVMAGSPNNL